MSEYSKPLPVDSASSIIQTHTTDHTYASGQDRDGTELERDKNVFPKKLPERHVFWNRWNIGCQRRNWQIPSILQAARPEHPVRRRLHLQSRQRPLSKGLISKASRSRLSAVPMPPVEGQRLVTPRNFASILTLNVSTSFIWFTCTI